MTFVQLRMFLELSKTNSMGLCAQSLGTSKQNVSNTISNLEKELGIQLFFKSRKGTFLTPAGEDILRYAQEIITDCDAILNYEHNEIRDSWTLHVMYPDVLSSLVQPLLEMFSEQHLQTHIHTTSVPAPHLYPPEATSDIDFISGMVLKVDLDSLEPYKDDYLIYNILESPIGLIAPEDQLAPDGRHDISISDLQRFDFIFSVNPSVGDEEPQGIISNYLKRHDLVDKLKITQCNSMITSLQHLTHSYSAIFDEYDYKQYHAKHEIRETLKPPPYRFLRIHPEETGLHYIMIRRDSPAFASLSEAMATLFNKFADNFPHIERIS